MHIADILSRLAGKDLEPSDQLIPISFNVHTRSSRPLKQYYANKPQDIDTLQNGNTKNHTNQTASTICKGTTSTKGSNTAI